MARGGEYGVCKEPADLYLLAVALRSFFLVLATHLLAGEVNTSLAGAPLHRRLSWWLRYYNPLNLSWRYYSMLAFRFTARSWSKPQLAIANHEQHPFLPPLPFLLADHPPLLPLQVLRLQMAGLLSSQGLLTLSSLYQGVLAIQYAVSTQGLPYLPNVTVPLAMVGLFRVMASPWVATKIHVEPFPYPPFLTPAPRTPFPRCHLPWRRVGASSPSPSATSDNPPSAPPPSAAKSQESIISLSSVTVLESAHPSSTAALPGSAAAASRTPLTVCPPSPAPLVGDASSEILSTSNAISSQDHSAILMNAPSHDRLSSSHLPQASDTAPLSPTPDCPPSPVLPSASPASKINRTFSSDAHSTPEQVTSPRDEYSGPSPDAPLHGCTANAQTLPISPPRDRLPSLHAPHASDTAPLPPTPDCPSAGLPSASPASKIDRTFSSDAHSTTQPVTSPRDPQSGTSSDKPLHGCTAHAHSLDCLPSSHSPHASDKPDTAPPSPKLLLSKASNAPLHGCTAHTQTPHASIEQPFAYKSNKLVVGIWLGVLVSLVVMAFLPYKVAAAYKLPATMLQFSMQFFYQYIAITECVFHGYLLYQGPFALANRVLFFDHWIFKIQTAGFYCLLILMLGVALVDFTNHEFYRSCA